MWLEQLVICIYNRSLMRHAILQPATRRRTELCVGCLLVQLLLSNDWMLWRLRFTLCDASGSDSRHVSMGPLDHMTTCSGRSPLSLTLKLVSGWIFRFCGKISEQNLFISTSCSWHGKEKSPLVLFWNVSWTASYVTPGLSNNTSAIIIQALQ